MSGGCFEHICWDIENKLCGKMQDPEMNNLIQDIANLVHDLEWTESGDYSEDEYAKSLAKFKKKWFKDSRKERLKCYIDASISELKQQLYNMIDISTEVSEENENECCNN